MSDFESGWGEHCDPLHHMDGLACPHCGTSGDNSLDYANIVGFWPTEVGQYPQNAMTCGVFIRRCECGGLFWAHCSRTLVRYAKAGLCPLWPEGKVSKK